MLKLNSSNEKKRNQEKNYTKKEGKYMRNRKCHSSAPPPVFSLFSLHDIV